MKMKSIYDELPPQGEIIMVESKWNEAQCEIIGDTAYTWEGAYPEGKPTIQFCKVHEIKGWRRCSGFDF